MFLKQMWLFLSAQQTPSLWSESAVVPCQVVQQYYPPKVITYRDQVNLHFSITTEDTTTVALASWCRLQNALEPITGYPLIFVYLFYFYSKFTLLALLISLKLLIYYRIVYIYSSSFSITSLFHLIICMSGTHTLPTKILQCTVG